MIIFFIFFLYPHFLIFQSEDISHSLVHHLAIHDVQASIQSHCSLQPYAAPSLHDITVLKVSQYDFQFHGVKIQKNLETGVKNSEKNKKQTIRRNFHLFFLHISNKKRNFAAAKT